MKKLNKIFANIVLAFFAVLFISTASAFTYSTAAKTARMNGVIATIDADLSAGTLEIGTASMATVCVSVPLNYPSGTVSGAVLSFSGFPKTVAAIASCAPAAEARIKDNSGDIIISDFTVGTSATDVIIDNTSINAGQNVTVNATPSITHAP